MLCGFACMRRMWLDYGLHTYRTGAVQPEILVLTSEVYTCVVGSKTSARVKIWLVRASSAVKEGGTSVTSSVADTAVLTAVRSASCRSLYFFCKMRDGAEPF